MNDSSNTLAIIIGVIILHFVIGIGIVVYKIATAKKTNFSDDDTDENENDSE